MLTTTRRIKNHKLGNGQRTIDPTALRHAAIGRLALKLSLNEALLGDGFACEAERDVDRNLVAAGIELDGVPNATRGQLDQAAATRVQRQATVGRLLIKLAASSQLQVDDVEALVDEGLDRWGVNENYMDATYFASMLTAPREACRKG